MDPAIVLLSGGWESAACLIKAKQKYNKPVALFVDYGQPYLKQEQEASLAIANAFKVLLLIESIDPIERTGKFFDQRNEKILRVAKKYRPKEIYLGCRSPLDIFDAYKDSNWQFAKRMSVELDVKVKTPIIMWPKLMVRSFVCRHIGAQHIFSSEGFKYEHCQSN